LSGTYIHIGPFSINSAGLGQIQFDWKQISIKYKKKKRKIDENNGKEKVPRKSEKMPKYMPN